MRAVSCFLGISQLLGISLAATLPATPISIPHNSTRLLHELFYPAPAAPYTTLQDQLALTFYDYGAPLPPNVVRRLVLQSLRRINYEHGAGSKEKIGRKVAYSLQSLAIGGTLQFSVEPEEDMTWGMFAIATVGVERFLERWDNVELAVNVDERMNGERRLGTVHLSRST